MRIAKAIGAIFDNFKISTKTPYPSVKFHEKHDSEVSEPVQPTVFELCPNFVQKLGQVQPKMALAQF